MFLLPLGPALARVDCEALVPAPVDVVPIRSPQSVHTRLANRFRNRTVVEIGTRNGDGMQCFAQVAKRVVAIEKDRRYCTKLSTRRKKLRQHGLGDYDILCDRSLEKVTPIVNVTPIVENADSLRFFAPCDSLAILVFLSLLSILEIDYLFFLSF